MDGMDLSCETTSQQVKEGEVEVARRARQPGLLQIFPLSEEPPRTFAVSTPTVIGRSSQGAIRLGDQRVSRRHAEVQRKAAGLFIRDLGSRHGSFVNGAVVSREGTVAPFGAVVRVGETLFLAVEDVSLYGRTPHRLAPGFLDTRREVIAGPTLLRTWEQASRAAALRHPVLIVGESGSGKEVIARLIHAGAREKGPFLALNVAAVPDSLFEAELFGHVRGAFTGAVGARKGAFREASGGVLFLDEVGELRPDLQVKLLRAIDQSRVRPVGGSEDIAADTRVVAATNQDLRQAVAEGRFRLDLYHRLAGIVVRVPSLRERRDEILIQARAILDDESPGLCLSAEAAERLVLHAWAGNSRELCHALGQASLQALSAGRGEITSSDLSGLTISEERGELTAERVQAVMRTARGNASLAAQSLGVSRATLYNHFRRLGLSPRELRATR
jgi:transcriptional regulator of acetoin/glycerol metabolism